VIGDAVDVEDRDLAVSWNPEERCLLIVRWPYLDRVAVAGLLDAELFVQVDDGPLPYVRGLDQPCRTLQDQAHGIERGLEREGDAVDEALIVPADDLVALADPERVGDGLAGPLQLHPGIGHGRGPPTGLHLRDVDVLFAAAPALYRVTSQRGDEGIDLLDHEGALAGPGLDHATGGEQLDGVPDGVARGAVRIHELDLGRQLGPARDLAGVDLAT